MQHTLRIYNGTLTIDDVSLPLSSVEKNHKTYYTHLSRYFQNSTELKSFFYQMGGDKNKVIYKSGQVKNLPIDDECLNELIADRYMIEFSYKEDLKIKKYLEEVKSNNPEVVLYHIFKANFNERDALLSKYRNERGGIAAPTNSEYNSYLNTYKKKELKLSDWTQLPDVDLSREELEAWTEYRAKVRNLDKSSDPYNKIQLPNRPNS